MRCWWSLFFGETGFRTRPTSVRWAIRHFLLQGLLAFCRSLGKFMSWWFSRKRKGNLSIMAISNQRINRCGKWVVILVQVGIRLDGFRVAHCQVLLYQPNLYYNIVQQYNLNYNHRGRYKSTRIMSIKKPHEIECPILWKVPLCTKKSVTTTLLLIDGLAYSLSNKAVLIIQFSLVSSKSDLVNNLITCPLYLGLGRSALAQPQPESLFQI